MLWVTNQDLHQPKAAVVLKLELRKKDTLLWMSYRNTNGEMEAFRALQFSCKGIYKYREVPKGPVPRGSSGAIKTLSQTTARRFDVGSGEKRFPWDSLCLVNFRPYQYRLEAEGSWVILHFSSTGVVRLCGIAENSYPIDQQGHVVLLSSEA